MATEEVDIKVVPIPRTIEQPPRSTGNIQADYVLLMDWAYRLYQVMQQSVAYINDQTSTAQDKDLDLTDLPDPETSTIAIAQQTANAAFVLANNNILADGKEGGQTVIGGTKSGEDLTLKSTSDAVKGNIHLGDDSTYDEKNVRLGINTTSPTSPLDVNGDSIRLRTSQTPASPGASGNTGQIMWDEFYIYVCVAPSTWKRALISTWVP